MGDVTYKIKCTKCGVVHEHDTRDHGVWLDIGSQIQCKSCGAVHEGVLGWAFREMKPLPPPKPPYRFDWPLGQEPKKRKRK